MAPERAFSDEEVAAILTRAAADDAAGTPRTSPRGGLPLSELKQIAAEAGIGEGAIDRAVRSLSISPMVSASSGLSVALAVDLPATFSDQDWNRLVFDLHETLLVPGEVLMEGALRQWRNDHYHVLVEPSEVGYKLRLRTQSDGPAAASMGVLLGGGLLFFFMGLFFMLLLAVKGDLGDLAKTLLMSTFAAVGLISMGVGAYRLPRWREEQKRLFEQIATRAIEGTAP